MTKSISKSHTAKPSPEVIELIKKTAPLREQAIYWAELIEWSELPLYRRIFTQRPVREATMKHNHNYKKVGKRRQTLYLLGLLGGSGPKCIKLSCDCGDSRWIEDND